MKVIESWDEWWEANQLHRLEYDEGCGNWAEVPVYLEGLSNERLINPVGINQNIKNGRFRWKPEQIKLVEWRCGKTRVFLPEDTLPADIPKSLNSTGEVFLAEVMTDGE